VIYHIIKLVPEYKAASKKVYKESCIQKDELKRASIQAYNDKIRRATVAVKDKRMHEGGWNQGLLVPPQQAFRTSKQIYKPWWSKNNSFPLILTKERNDVISVQILRSKYGMTFSKIGWFLANQIPHHKILPWAEENSFTLELACIKDTPLSRDSKEVGRHHCKAIQSMTVNK